VLEKIQEAREFARQLHRNQTHNGKPYVQHLDEVSETLTFFGYHPDITQGKINKDTCEVLQISAYLHDVLEDTPIDRYTIRKVFGDAVEKLVYAVSDGNGSNRKEKKEITYERIKETGLLAIILKLADRISNVKFSDSRSVFQMYWREQEAFKRALHIPGECEEMWRHLETLFSSRRRYFYPNEQGDLR